LSPLGLKILNGGFVRNLRHDLNGIWTAADLPRPIAFMYLGTPRVLKVDRERKLSEIPR